MALSRIELRSIIISRISSVT